MGKIYTIGEALIDFIPVQTAANLSAVDAFQKRPGGAPANVAVAAQNLGLNLILLEWLEMTHLVIS